MHWLDTLILIMLAFGAILGAFKGFLWQLSRVISLVLGVYCAVVFNAIATPFIQKHFMPDSTELAAQATAFVVVFIAVCLTLLVLTLVLDAIVQRIHLQWLNRLLGSVFGAVKLGFALGIVFLGLSYFPGMNLMMGESKIAPVLVDGIKLVGATIPEEYTSPVDEKLKKHLKNNPPKMELPEQNPAVEDDKPTTPLVDQIIQNLSTSKK